MSFWVTVLMTVAQLQDRFGPGRDPSRAGIDCHGQSALHGQALQRASAGLRIHIYVYINIYGDMGIDTGMCMYTCIYIHICICIGTHVYIFVCTCIRMYFYTFISTHTRLNLGMPLRIWELGAAAASNRGGSVGPVAARIAPEARPRRRPAACCTAWGLFLEIWGGLSLRRCK